MLSATEGHTEPGSLHSSFAMLCYQSSPCSPAPAETGLCEPSMAAAQVKLHLREEQHHSSKIKQFLPDHQATLNFSGKHWMQDDQGQKRDVSVEQRAG